MTGLVQRRLPSLARGWWPDGRAGFASLVAVYALLVSTLVYRELKWAMLPPATRSSTRTSEPSGAVTVGAAATLTVSVPVVGRRRGERLHRRLDPGPDARRRQAFLGPVRAGAGGRDRG